MVLPVSVSFFFLSFFLSCLSVSLSFFLSFFLFFFLCLFLYRFLSFVLSFPFLSFTFSVSFLPFFLLLFLFELQFLWSLTYSVSFRTVAVSRWTLHFMDNLSQQSQQQELPSRAGKVQSVSVHNFPPSRTRHTAVIKAYDQAYR